MFVIADIYSITSLQQVIISGYDDDNNTQGYLVSFYKFSMQNTYNCCTL
jgi:hypothetical protein